MNEQLWHLPESYLYFLLWWKVSKYVTGKKQLVWLKPCCFVLFFYLFACIHVVQTQLEPTFEPVGCLVELVWKVNLPDVRNVTLKPKHRNYAHMYTGIWISLWKTATWRPEQNDSLVMMRLFLARALVWNPLRFLLLNRCVKSSLKMSLILNDLKGDVPYHRAPLRVMMGKSFFFYLIFGSLKILLNSLTIALTLLCEEKQSA